MKRIFFFFVIFIFSIQTISAQSGGRGLIGTTNNIGSLIFTVGPSYMFGDMGGATRENSNALSSFNASNVRYEASLGLRHSLDYRFGYRVSIHHGLYESRDIASLAHRGYASTSSITMLTAVGEINLIQFLRSAVPWRLYAYGGGGVAYASIDWKGGPMRGASDTFKASELAPILPFGLGFDIWTNSNVNVGLEVGWKFALSDYMDGLRIRNTSNDIMGNVSFTISRRLFGGGTSRRNYCVWCK